VDKIWPCDDDASTRFPIFTRANTGEVFTDAATPLTWSVLGRGVYENGYRDALYQMGVFTPADFRPEFEGEVVGCFGGYVYINVSLSRVLAVRTPGMDWRAIDQAFFGESPDVPPYRPHPLDENQQCSERMVEWMTSLFTAASVPAIDRMRAEIDAMVAARPDLTTLSDTELITRYRGIVPEMRRAFAVHINGLYSANIVAGVLAQISAAVGMPDRVSALTAGLGGVDSAQQSFDIWDLSRIARESAAVGAEFDRGADGVVDRLRGLDDDGARAFLHGWAEFLGSWGFLGPSVWEMRSPTYASHPGIPLRMIDHARRVPDSGSPQSRGGHLVGERERAAQEIAARIADPAMLAQFQAAVAVLPVHLPAREASKVQCTRLCDEARMTLRELGQRFAGTGVLPRWQDVLLLMDDEIDSFLIDPSPWAGTIRDRAERLRLLESLWPPFIFEGPPPALDQFVPRADDTMKPAAPGDVLTGLGASPGTHTGRARVIGSLTDDAEVDDGDVLIARTTDSSWGPLFLTAGAVVCETGAAISHAAIVSRELGIPSAVSVEGCMSRILDGMTVLVNGDDGTVTVVEAP
jgi:phosphohistidine swiveling domain-containing protein